MHAQVRQFFLSVSGVFLQWLSRVYTRTPSCFLAWSMLDPYSVVLVAWSMLVRVVRAIFDVSKPLSWGLERKLVESS